MKIPQQPVAPLELRRKQWSTWFLEFLSAGWTHPENAVSGSSHWAWQTRFIISAMPLFWLMCMFSFSAFHLENRLSGSNSNLTSAVPGISLIKGHIPHLSKPAWAEIHLAEHRAGGSCRWAEIAASSNNGRAPKYWDLRVLLSFPPPLHSGYFFCS